MNEFTQLIDTFIENKYNNSTERMIIATISDYKSNNNDILSSSSIDKLVFTEIEQAKLFKIFGTTPKEIKSMINKSTYIDKKWVIGSNPFNLLCASIIRQVLLRKGPRHKELAILITEYMLYRLYPSRFWNSFPHGILSNVMAYTINNLTYKFAIKVHGILSGAILQTAQSLLENHMSRLENADDKCLVDFVNDGHTRIGGFIKKIAEEYYANYENGNYLNYEQDKITDDSYQKADSNQFMIQRAADKVMAKLLLNGVDVKLVDYASKFSDAPYLPLVNAVNTIFDLKKDRLQEFISKVITIYVINVNGVTERELGSQKFFTETYKIYKKNNTNDKNILDVKEIIHEWLLECSDRYRKTNREATLNNFKKGIYLYFVLMIQKNVK